VYKDREDGDKAMVHCQSEREIALSPPSLWFTVSQRERDSFVSTLSMVHCQSEREIERVETKPWFTVSQREIERKIETKCLFSLTQAQGREIKRENDDTETKCLFSLTQAQGREIKRENDDTETKR
jgi:hypothetical protein